MSAKTGGSFATALLAIPLAAIPLMAIFGIPEFAQLAASVERSGPDIVRGPSPPPTDYDGSSPVTTEDYRSRAADLFAPRNSEPATGSLTDRGQGLQNHVAGSAQEGDRPARNVDSTGSSSQPSRFRILANSRSSDPPKPSPRPMLTSARETQIAESFDQQTSGATSETAFGLTWREAARRLEEIGIMNYELQRGHRTNQFLFVCLFSPGSDPRVIQRFEAESAEPLEAVEDVLAQVDNWLQHRYAESRRWVR